MDMLIIRGIGYSYTSFIKVIRYNLKRSVYMRSSKKRIFAFLNTLIWIAFKSLYRNLK